MTSALADFSVAPESAPARSAGIVGPNAAIQLAAALTDGLGRSAAIRVFERAGHGALLATPPAEMIDETVAAALFASLWRELPSHVAQKVAKEAGARTGAYVIANRIPKPAALLLKALPASIAAPLLLKAIRRNAWTFAGSGHCTVRRSQPAVIEIANNPLAMPGCAWHCAVFETLFRTLVSASSRVSHPVCRNGGGRLCRFEICTSHPRRGT